MYFGKLLVPAVVHKLMPSTANHNAAASGSESARVSDWLSTAPLLWAAAALAADHPVIGSCRWAPCWGLVGVPARLRVAAAPGVN